MEILIIVSLILSVSAILGGYYMKYQSPKDKQMNIGFKTERAQSSPEAWKYANATCGKYWIIMGSTFLVLGLPIEFAFYYFKGDDAKMLVLVNCTFFVANLIYWTANVSKELNNKFDENGMSIE